MGELEECTQTEYVDPYRIGVNSLNSFHDRLCSKDGFIDPKDKKKIKEFNNAYWATYEPIFQNIHLSITNMLGYTPDIEHFIFPSEKHVDLLQKNLSESDSIFIALSFMNPKIDYWTNPKILEELKRAIRSKKELSFVFNNQWITEENGHNPFFNFLTQETDLDKLNIRIHIGKEYDKGLPFNTEIFDSHTLYEYPEREWSHLRQRIDCGSNPHISKMLIGFYDALEQQGKLKRIRSKEDLNQIKLREEWRPSRDGFLILKK